MENELLKFSFSIKIAAKQARALGKAFEQMERRRDVRNIRLWKATAGFKRMEKKPLLMRILSDAQLLKFPHVRMYRGRAKY